MRNSLLRLSQAGVALLGPLVLGACGDGNGPEPDPDPPTAASIALSDDTLSFTAVGDTWQLSGTVIDQYGDPMQGVDILWASDAPGVASIDASGLVTSRGDGQTSVRAQAGTVRASAFVEVTQEASEILELEGDEQFHWTGFLLSEPLRVKVVDGVGTPVVGFPVTWDVVEGDGDIVPVSPITDLEGEASAHWLLGEGPSGMQRVFATGPELDSVFFSATGTAPVRLTNAAPPYRSYARHLDGQPGDFGLLGCSTIRDSPGVH